MNDRDNDRVAVVEISGIETENPETAVRMMHGAVVLTKGKTGLFQVSINPEEGETMTPQQWQRSVQALGEEFGLDQQPHAIFEHEKEGRTHRHVVFQLTDTEAERLIPVDNFKRRCVPLARELEREFGHERVSGTRSHQFDQAAFRQAKRIQDRDPRERSAFIREAWDSSETPDQFRDALRESGYELAQGDRARFVLLDAASGEILRGALPRHLKTAERAAPRAAELRQWAEGLSMPLQPVEAVREQIRDAERFDRDAYNAKQQERDEQAGLRPVT